MNLRKNGREVLAEKKGFQLFDLEEGQSEEIKIDVMKTNMAGRYVVTYNLKVERLLNGENEKWRQ